jgi:hypothetical protein
MEIKSHIQHTSWSNAMNWTEHRQARSFSARDILGGTNTHTKGRVLDSAIDQWCAHPIAKDDRNSMSGRERKSGQNAVPKKTRRPRAGYENR